MNSELYGLDWRQDEGSGAYRMVIKRKDKHPGLQGVFYAFPERRLTSLYIVYANPHKHWLTQEFLSSPGMGYEGSLLSTPGTPRQLDLLRSV